MRGPWGSFGASLDKIGETSEATLKSYKTNLRDFMDWLGERRSEDLNDIRSTDIASYRNSLLVRVSQSTATNKIKSLRAMFTAAKQEGLCLKDPTANLKLKRKSENDGNIQRRPFTLEELKLIREEATGEWDYQNKLSTNYTNLQNRRRAGNKRK